jgi:hypothetical protein
LPILKAGVVAAVSVTVALLLLLHTDTPQLKEFLLLLSPAYLIVILSVLSRVIVRTNTRHSKHIGARTALSRITLWIISGIFVLNIIGVFVLYVFSRDESFDDWRYGHWHVDNFESLYASADDIPIQNVEAVAEARRILLPLRPYIIECCNAHDVSPNAVAAFILVNRMLREKYPTYDFNSGLAHLFWHWRVFPEQRNMYDNSPLYRSEAGRWLLHILPTHIRLQDRAADFLGGLILGGSTTMGNMQIKAGPIRGFELEKSVRADDLWKRSGIDVSSMSDREINWLLMTDPRLDIEAGVTALRQSIDNLASLQKEGSIVCAVDLSAFIDDAGWFHIFSDIDDNLSDAVNASPRTVTLHDLTNYLRLEPKDIYRLNYMEYYAIAIQSGIFEDSPDAEHP